MITSRILGVLLAFLLLAPRFTWAQPVVQPLVQGEESSLLAKIERKIAKEPAYRGTPKYCLAVFGPATKTRIWLVIDGDTLYVDLNGNGDLTEKGESFRLEKSDRGGYSTIRLGDILDGHTLLKHQKFEVSPWNGDTFQLGVEAAFERVKVPSLYGFAIAEFGNKPTNAPIVHFGGPLWMQPSIATIAERPAFICAEIGTPGIGKGSFVYYTKSVLSTVNAKLRPDLELEYTDEKNTVVREKVKFMKEDFESVYLFPVKPGKKGDDRKVKMTLSFDDVWSINVAPRTTTRAFFTLDK